MQLIFVLLPLHPAALMNSFISSNSECVCMWNLYRVFYIKIILSANRQFYFFLSNLDTFFSYLIALARTSSTILNSLGESGPSCLVPEFSRKGFSFSLLCVGYGFVISGIMLRYIPSNPTLIRVFFFYHEWILNSAKYTFCVSTQKGFLSFHLFL